MSSRKQVLCALTTWLLVSVSVYSIMALDCSKNRDLKAIRNCCTMPYIQIDTFKDICSKYMKNGLRFSPCLFECVFNATNLMRGSMLNIENARALGIQLLGNKSEFVDAYVAGLQKCIGVIDQMRKFKSRKLSLPLGGDNCSPAAMILGMCAHKYAYSDCPVASRSDTEECKQLQKYALNC